jgi:hypothetical protein
MSLHRTFPAVKVFQPSNAIADYVSDYSAANDREAAKGQLFSDHLSAVLL